MAKKYTGLFGRIRQSVSADGLGLAFVLDFIVSRTDAGQQTRITDLVQSLAFGTGPTVFSKVQALIASGYIESTVSETDSRAKALAITVAGKKWIAELEEKMA